MSGRARRPFVHTSREHSPAPWNFELSGTGTRLAAASVRTIGGADTGLANPLGIAVIHSRWPARSTVSRAVPDCCPTCRLVQPEAASCLHCGDVPVPFSGRRLLTELIEGIARVSKPPPSPGWQDKLALWSTGFGIFVAAGAGMWLTHSGLGLLAGPVVGGLGYRKQFWRAVVVRRPRPRLQPIVEPAKQPGAGDIAGVAQRFERTVVTAVTREPVLATVIAIRAPRGGLLLRAIDAAPFWLVSDDRRVLVTGPCWPAIDGVRVPIEPALDAIGAPASLVPRDAVAVEAVVRAGDRIIVTGVVQQEQVPGHGGYRDAVAEVMHGERGAITWIVAGQ